MLTGKTAIVTGGSRGIGEAIAHRLAALGADIAVIYAGNSVCAENVCSSLCSEYEIKAKAYCCDVSDFRSVKQTVSDIKADFGNVHILVNNAGITCDGLAAMMSEEAFDRVISTNLKGAFKRKILMRRLCLLIREERALLSERALWHLCLKNMSTQGRGEQGYTERSAATARPAMHIILPLRTLKHEAAHRQWQTPCVRQITRRKMLCISMLTAQVRP